MHMLLPEIAALLKKLGKHKSRDQSPKPETPQSDMGYQKGP